MLDLDVRNEEGEVLTETQPLWKKRRYHLVVLVFLGFINIYTLRINLSVGIVGMKHFKHQFKFHLSNLILAMTENRTITNEDGSPGYQQDFDWDSKQQGLVLSSFFYGYACTQFIGGIMAARFGGHVVSIATLSAQLFHNFLLPLDSRVRHFYNFGVDLVISFSGQSRDWLFCRSESTHGTG